MSLNKIIWCLLLIFVFSSCEKETQKEEINISHDYAHIVNIDDVPVYKTNDRNSEVVYRALKGTILWGLDRKALTIKDIQDHFVKVITFNEIIGFVETKYLADSSNEYNPAMINTFGNANISLSGNYYEQTVLLENEILKKYKKFISRFDNTLVVTCKNGKQLTFENTEKDKIGIRRVVKDKYIIITFTGHEYAQFQIIDFDDGAKQDIVGDNILFNIDGSKAFIFTIDENMGVDFQIINLNDLTIEYRNHNYFQLNTIKWITKDSLTGACYTPKNPYNLSYFKSTFYIKKSNNLWSIVM
jgi:hypothetical protein